MLFSLGFVDIILPREVLLANHLASTNNLTSNNQQTEHIQMQTNVTTKTGHNKQQYAHSKQPMLTERTDREHGLVTFYNIWPRNRAGLFLQPRSLHGAIKVKSVFFTSCIYIISITTNSSEESGLKIAFNALVLRVTCHIHMYVTFSHMLPVNPLQ